MVHIFTPLLLVILCSQSSFAESCYTNTQQAIACYPADTSLSFERGMEATSTCGMEGPVVFSVRISVSQVDCCQICDSQSDNSSHPPTFLTDLHIVTDETTWLSETGIYSPSTVNLTLSLPGSAELDTLKLHFTSYKPHSFYLEKSRDGTTYEVMRYFSVDCEEKYGLDPIEEVLTDNQVVCEEVISNTPGIVLYIPEQTRPIGQTAPPEESDTLTDFVTFSHLRVVLDGHMTYPSQPPNTTEGDQSYYYQLADLSVTGRCACNGHASQCDDVTLSCMCEHNTRGTSCEECASFYQDQPWKRSTPSIPFECKECECNSHSTSCYFNSTLYTESNNTSGGVCIDCMHNTVGIHCGICRDTFYTNATKSPSDADVCLECACNQIGVITNGVCEKTAGQCDCKRNVQGRTCDQCKYSFYNLTSDNTLGCSPCNCNIFGSITPRCDTSSGQCQCRENTQSQTCDECKLGYYNIMSGTMDGCLECLCDLGGSLFPVCDPSTGQCVCRDGLTGRQCSERAHGYFIPLIDYVTQEGERSNGSFTPLLLTTGVNQEFTGTGYASLAPSNTLTFLSPISVTTSGIYQLVIRYTLRNLTNISLILRFDVKPPNIPTDSACNQQILTHTIISISNVIPGTSLHASTDVCLNSNIEYTLTVTHGSTHSHVLIDSMRSTCECVEPRKQLNTWASVDTNFCNPITLSLSAELYNGLLPCACYTRGAIGDNCTFEGQCSCLSGVGSDRTCSMCMPGYFSLIPGVGCSACGCTVNGSTSRVCDFANGQCDCLSLVDGDKCSECEIGAYNFTSGLGCESCDCSILGSANIQCSEAGECTCRPGVEGEKCDKCIDGFYGLGINGCTSCNCNINGVRVENSTCHTETGECQCKGNVEGRMCTECIEGYFNLDGANPTGCRACYCSGPGVTTCSAATGYVQDKDSTRFNANSSDILDGWTTLDDNGNAFLGYFPFTTNNRSSIGLFFTVQYLSAPAKYLTFKLSSYTQSLSIQFTLYPIPQTLPTLTCPPYTLLLRGCSMEIATCTQLGVVDSNGFVSIDIHLHETAHWIITDTGTAVTELEFLQVLARLTHLFIRGNFLPDTNTYLHQVSLPIAVRGTGTAVSWVESCLCNANYSGPSCTKCASGFYRRTDGSCIQCNCFGNSSQLSCDPNTGECVMCPPSTTGASCESCVPGYYGSPSDGINCLPCTCPGQSSGSFSPICELIPPAFLPTHTPPGEDLECTNCSQGHEGMRCEFCQQNYYGDPVNYIGCIPCDCNGNIALEEPGNCDNVSGVCLRCVGNTAGESCQVCATGFYGDAIQAKNCSRVEIVNFDSPSQQVDYIVGSTILLLYYSDANISDSLIRWTTETVTDGTDTQYSIEYANPVLLSTVFSDVGAGVHTFSCFYRMSNVTLVGSLQLAIKDTAVISISYAGYNNTFSDVNNIMFPFPQLVQISEGIRDILLTCNVTQCMWLIQLKNETYTVVMSPYSIPIFGEENEGNYSLIRETNSGINYTTSHVYIHAQLHTTKQPSSSPLVPIAIVAVVIVAIIILIVVILVLILLKKRQFFYTIDANESPRKFFSLRAKDRHDNQCNIPPQLNILDTNVAEYTTIEETSLIPSETSTSAHILKAPYCSEISEDIIYEQVDGNSEYMKINPSEPYEEYTPMSGVREEKKFVARYIPAKDFPVTYQQYVASAVRNDSVFSVEFQALNEESQKYVESIDEARKEQNMQQNLLTNILPYDENRVVLDSPYFDCNYINASWLESYEFIASIHPTGDTLKDFLQMIYQTEASMVIMLTTRKEKAKIIGGVSTRVCYWPKKDEPLKCEPFETSLITTTETTAFVKQEISLKNSLEGRDHSFTHCISPIWNEDGTVVEMTCVIALLNRIIKQKQDSANMPIILHCTDGISKTGIIMTALNSIKELNARKSINIFNTVKNLRRQRMNMIPTLACYTTCFSLMNEYCSIHL